ncbi:hypothetical protein UF75_4262 [Desulfosporosinus sp. I2]|nr:hypothetical protein UF75_4262 [Desulfosporosinus sp. I2]
MGCEDEVKQHWNKALDMDKHPHINRHRGSWDRSYEYYG